MDHSHLKRRLAWAPVWRGLALPFGLLVGLLLSCAPAQAADGCKVLLCMAGNWRNIAACEPEVRQAMRDAARGRGWPRCSMASGGGSSGSTGNSSGTGTTDTVLAAAPATHASENQWAWAPGNCPQQYTVEIDAGFSGPSYVCRYLGVINVWINGQLWSRTWWDSAGDTSTDYSEQARAQLGQTIDPKFDNDLKAWEVAQAAAASANVNVTVN